MEDKNSLNSLVLFTISFPYGQGEAFIEAEVPILANKFHSIFIIPSSKVDGLRKLPSNVHLLDCLTERNKEVAFKNVFKLFNKLSPLFLFTLIQSSDRWKYCKFWKSFLHFAIDDLSKQALLKEIIREHGLEDAIYYDYWFVNSTLTISNLKKEGVIKKAVARCHRFDLYDEELYEGVVSFREYKINYLDKILPISLHGKQYLINKVSEKYHYKIHQFYLGTNSPKNQKGDKANSMFQIVSCSRVVEHKKITEIIKVLSILNLNIHWVHFGSGPLLEFVKNKSKELPSNIHYEFWGEVNNSEIIDYYSNNYIDLFISLSESEGVPVSMMEASMFGIPIVAKSVYGVAEIVVNGCGFLLDVKSGAKETAEAVRKALLCDFDRENIRRITNEKFNGYKNFSDFSDFLIQKI